MLANCFRRVPVRNAGAGLDGRPGSEPGCRGGAVVAAPALSPCAQRWAALAAQCGRGCRRGKGKRGRGGGREEAAWEESGCVCGREGGCLTSCFLSVSAGGEGGAGSLVTQAGQFEETESVSSRHDQAQSFPCLGESKNSRTG